MNWVFDEDLSEQEKYNWTVDANRICNVSGPVSKEYKEMKGTLANCSGTKKPFGEQYLACEENYHNFKDRYLLKDFDMNQYGWIVEIDPYEKNSLPVKHTALGKMAHENAEIALADSNEVVVYMGDDKANEHIYKFVSDKKFNKTDKDFLTGREFLLLSLIRNLDFTKAESGIGSWELMDLDNDKLKDNFKSQSELLLNTRKAAKLLKLVLQIDLSLYQLALSRKRFL